MAAVEKNIGLYADYDACPEQPISWRLFAKRKNGKLSYVDVVNELFVNGMEGNLYAQLFKVPEELPGDSEDSDNRDRVELLEPEDACKLLAQWCRYKLYDDRGNQLV